MQRNRTQGFSLIELAVTLVVASIVISIVVSSFRNTTRRNNLTVHINAFVGAMQFARSEAIKRGVSVTIHEGRFTGGSWVDEWRDGWEIFVDPERDGNKDGNPTMRIGGQLPQGFTLRSNSSNPDRISFQPNGRTNLSRSLVLCDDFVGTGIPTRGTSRMISLIRTGRVRIAVESGNGIPIKPDGNDLNSCIAF